MCMIDDSERFEFGDEEIRTARKTHRCSECGRQILPKERYACFKGKFEDRFETYKTCSHCLVAKEWLSEECGGYIFQGVYEDMSEHFYEGCGLATGRIAVGMRRKWKKFNSEELMSIPRMPKLSHKQ